MIQLQNFLLVSGIQVLVFSVVLLAVASVVRQFLKRRADALIVSGLAAIVLLWFVALLPLPGWLDWTAAYSLMELAEAGDRGTDLAAGQAGEGQANPHRPGSLIDTNMRNQWSFQEYLISFGQQLQQATVNSGHEGAATKPWIGWLLAFGATLIALGLIRFLVAIVWVAGLKRQGTLIDARSVGESLENVQDRMNCRRPITIMEIGNGNAPFTIGWRRPVIFLSSDWQQWNPGQLEAILAHEIAHIQNRDFLHRLLAQFTVALNFYNPLVHWLGRQLVVEQELAADDRAAEITGGRRTYLNTLAEMALETDCPKSRLAPMFLPTRKTFFRRIEMLRIQKDFGGNSRLFRSLGMLLVVMIGIGVAGLRFPGNLEADRSAVNETTYETSLAAADLRYVTHDPDLLIVTRPAAIYSVLGDMLNQVAPGGVDDKDAAQWAGQFQEQFGIAVENADQLSIVFDGISSAEASTTFVLESSQDIGWLAGDDVTDQMKSRLDATPAGSWRSLKLFERADEHMSTLVCSPDSRTLLICYSTGLADNHRDVCLNAMKNAIRAKAGTSDKSWFEDWSAYSDHAVSTYVSGDVINTVSQQFSDPSNPFTAMLSPLWEQSDYAVGGLQLSDKLKFEFMARCPDPEGSAAISRTVKTLVPVARTMVENWGQSAKSSIGNQDSSAVDGMLDMQMKVIDSARVTTTDSTVTLTLGLGGDEIGLAQTLVPVIVATRAAARRTQSANNLRQISLAMLNYQSAHGTFPPPVLTSDSGRKYSWRVALLPFLEQQNLYDHYRFDEDWDSEHNREVTRHIPMIYRHPSDAGPVTNSCYFVVTGDETPFAATGARLEEISDGTSNTICVVEANPGIHWAEPRDLEFAQDNLLERVGGFTSGGFNVSLCDGSVLFLSKSIGEEVLRQLLTSRGNVHVDPAKIR